MYSSVTLWEPATPAKLSIIDSLTYNEKTHTARIYIFTQVSPISIAEGFINSDLSYSNCIKSIPIYDFSQGA